MPSSKQARAVHGGAVRRAARESFERVERPRRRTQAWTGTRVDCGREVEADPVSTDCVAEESDEEDFRLRTRERWRRARRRRGGVRQQSLERCSAWRAASDESRSPKAEALREGWEGSRRRTWTVCLSSPSRGWRGRTRTRRRDDSSSTTWRSGRRGQDHARAWPFAAGDLAPGKSRCDHAEPPSSNSCVRLTSSPLAEARSWTFWTLRRVARCTSSTRRASSDGDAWSFAAGRWKRRRSGGGAHDRAARGTGWRQEWGGASSRRTSRPTSRRSVDGGGVGRRRREPVLPRRLPTSRRVSRHGGRATASACGRRPRLASACPTPRRGSVSPPCAAAVGADPRSVAGRGGGPERRTKSSEASASSSDDEDLLAATCIHFVAWSTRTGRHSSNGSPADAADGPAKSSPTVCRSPWTGGLPLRARAGVLLGFPALHAATHAFEGSCASPDAPPALGDVLLTGSQFPGTDGTSEPRSTGPAVRRSTGRRHQTLGSEARLSQNQSESNCHNPLGKRLSNLGIRPSARGLLALHASVSSRCCLRQRKWQTHASDVVLFRLQSNHARSLGPTTPPALGQCFRLTNVHAALGRPR